MLDNLKMIILWPGECVNHMETLRVFWSSVSFEGGGRVHAVGILPNARGSLQM